MALLGGNQWKAFAEVETQLMAKYASGPGSRPVAFINAGFNDMFKKLKILLHGLQVKPLTLKGTKESVFLITIQQEKSELIIRILKNHKLIY